MSDESTNVRKVPWLWLGSVVVLGGVLLAALLWPSSRQLRGLKPLVATQTAVPIVFDGSGLPVSFPDLQDGPAAYLEQRIRVTGRYARLSPPDCSAYSGPMIRWGVVADELQMNAIGMESVRHLIPVDTMLTIEGVWQRYVGPVGCGKEPVDDVIWYLAVERILQPNPLPLPGMMGSVAQPGTALLPTGTSTAVSGTGTIPTPTVEQTINPTAAITTLTPTATPTVNLFPVVTPTPGTQPTAGAGSPVPSLTPDTIGSTPTATSPSGSAPTATATATSTETVTPGPSPTSGGGNPPPVLPSATPLPTQDYPGPPTPDSTATSTPYP